MVLATNLGFPRIGAMRELKKAVEAYWKGGLDKAGLEKEAAAIRSTNWKLQKDAGLDMIPSGDFSYYDHILDTICALGLVPSRYKWGGGNVDLDTYFAMARGAQKDGIDVTAMEMTKWFDTNYHYIVPEFEEGMKPTLASTKYFDHYKEAKDLGIETRPCIIGPVTMAFIGKARYEGFDHIEFVKSLMPVYNEILMKLAALGAKWVQIDELSSRSTSATRAAPLPRPLMRI